MISKMFAILDNKAMAFMPPFTMRHENEAKRAFGELANDAQHQVGKHPTDFQLYELGSFNDISGELSPLDLPINHGMAIAYVKGRQGDGQPDLFTKVKLPLNNGVDAPGEVNS